MLANFITYIWFPVFLAGLLWGGFRKYKQDKAGWMQRQGAYSTPKSAREEFKDAARDIAQAGREMINRQAVEDAATAQEAQQESAQQAPEDQTPEQPQAPQSPLQPLV